MTVFDRVKKLSDKKKMSIVELEEKLGFGRNSLYSWKRKTPNGDSLKKVADYFNVSVDYLLGREEKPQYTSDDLEEMIDNAMSFNGRPLSDHDREVARAYLEGKFGVK